MEQLLKPTLVATDVIRSFSISTQYANLIDSLEACGFNEAGSSPTLKVFPYDWRKDIALAAKALGDLIDQFSQSLGGLDDI